LYSICLIIAYILITRTVNNQNLGFANKIGTQHIQVRTQLYFHTTVNASGRRQQHYFEITHSEAMNADPDPRPKHYIPEKLDDHVPGMMLP
jgi:hypothetical protein